MVEPSVARLLLAAARRDELASRPLAALPAMNDAVIGFRAHQCVEKALKAVLSHGGIAFRRTHDVGELLDRATAARMVGAVAGWAEDKLSSHPAEHGDRK